MSADHCSPPETSSSISGAAPSNALIDAFLTTRYRVLFRPQPMDVCIGRPCLQLNTLIDGSNWCIITACNPHAKHVGIERNRHATRALKRTLLKMNPEHLLPSVNISTDGSWPDEPGFLFSWQTPGQVGALARQFGQLGVVCGRDGGLPELWLYDDKLPVRNLAPHVRAMTA